MTQHYDATGLPCGVSYDARDLPDHICHFKKNETRKYRDAVCQLLQCKYEAIAPDGNCFFAAVAACFEHLQDPLTISATDVRARVVAWLLECKVRVPPLSHLEPHKPLHHLIPPCYRTESMELLGMNATNSCFKSWSFLCLRLWEPQVRQQRFKSVQWRSIWKQLQKMGYGCKVRSILWSAPHLIHHHLQTKTQNCTPPHTTTHHHTPPHHRKPPHTTVAHHLTPPYTTAHHRTPPYTTAHHHTPPHTTTPPYTTIHHCRTPPDTTLHHRAPPHTLTGYHWMHAVAAIFDVCVGVIVHHHQSTYMFGDPSKSCIHLYKKDETTHYDALVADPGIVAESSEIDGEWHCACSTLPPPFVEH